MLEPHDTDTQLLQSALARLNGVFATNTLRAYRADNLNFVEFCHAQQEAAYPASESELLAFIAHRAKSTKVHSLKRQIAAIHPVHGTLG